jgi:hypothetical protein
VGAVHQQPRHDPDRHLHGTGFDAFSQTTGQWELLRAPNGAHPANTFIVDSSGGGAEYYLDDAVVQATP